MLLDPTNTEPIPVHKPPLAKVLAVFVVLIVLLNVALGIAYLAKLARERVSVIPPDAVPEVVSTPETMQLSGIIREIGEKEFLLEIQASTEQVFGGRSVIISPETVVTKIVMLDSQTIEKNMEKFLKDMAAYKERVKKISPDDTTPFEERAPESPLSFTREMLDMSALELGQTVMVTTHDDAREVSDISAVSVEIVPSPTEPSIP